MKSSSYILISILLAAVLAAAPARAAGEPPAVRAYTDKTTVSTGEPFMFVIEITGRAPKPVIPSVDGLQIEAQPSTQSTKMEFSSFSATSTSFSQQVYGYQAYATKPGKLTIPPISLTIDEKPHQTAPVEITVVQAAVPQAIMPQNAARQPLPQQRPMPQRAQPQQSGDITLEQAVFIESNVDKTEVYQGEPVTLTLSVWVLNVPRFRVQSDRRQPLTPPECEGFYLTPIEEELVETTREGRAYNVYTFRRTLYPTVAGDLKIGEWQWQGAAYYGLQDWFINRLAPAIPVRVKPLPEPPQNFSGAVGEFALQAHLARDEAVQGVPMQLSIVITGTGNPDAVGAPRVPKVENAYISDPDPAPNAEQSAAAVAKHFTFTITPLEPGQLMIPPIEYCFFNPRTSQYKTERTQPLTIRVLRSAEHAGSGTLVTNRDEPQNGAVSMLSDDIFPLAAAPEDLRPAKGSSGAVPVAAAAPVLAYAGLALVMRRKRRFDRDPALARAHRAKARAAKRLQAAKAAADPAEELYKAIIGYVADRYNVPESGLTSTEVTQLLQGKNIHGDVTDHIRKVLRACERTRYGGAKLTPDESDALALGAGEAIEQLEAHAESAE